MKNYKEIYESLTQDIDNQKKQKQEVETTLKNLKKEKKIITLKEMELMDDIKKLKEERKNIMNQKTNPIVITVNTILVLLFILAIYLETSIISAIEAIGKRILVGIGLFIGFANLYMCTLVGILVGRDTIIKKIQNKNKDNERYIELTKRLKEKNKEITKVREEKQTIIEKIEVKENEMQEILNKLELNTQELEKLKEEIIVLVTGQNTETINNITEISETKPYTRTKIKEN